MQIHNDSLYVVAVLSCLLSSIVFLSFVMFPRLQQNNFMLIIAIISICDLLGNISVLFPRDEDVSCFIQGLFQNYWYLASFFWTATLQYHVYTLAKHEKQMKLWPNIHIMIWSGATVLTLLPLSTETYSQEAQDDDWCWINPRYNDNDYNSYNLTLAWQVISFWLPLFLSTAFCIFLSVSIYVKYWDDPQQERVHGLILKMLLYPMVILSCWVLNGIQSLGFPHMNGNTSFVIVVNALSIMQGGLVALLFITQSRELKRSWFPSLYRSTTTQFRRSSVQSESDRSTLGSRLTTVTISSVYTDTHSDNYSEGNTNAPPNSRNTSTNPNTTPNNTTPNTNPNTSPNTTTPKSGGLVAAYAYALFKSLFQEFEEFEDFNDVMVDSTAIYGQHTEMTHTTAAPTTTTTTTTATTTTTTTTPTPTAPTSTSTTNPMRPEPDV